MKTDSEPVWVIAEQMECHILPVSLQLVGKARRLAGKLGVPVEVVLLGSGLEEELQALFDAGADCIYLGDDPRLQHYEPELYLEMAVRCALAAKPGIILLGSTAMGRELAPLLAARLETGLSAHCIELEINADGILEQRIPAYGGLMSIVCPEKRPQMATVAQGVFPDPAPKPGRKGRIRTLPVPTDIPRRIQTLEVVYEKPEGRPIDTATTVVAGGAGAGDRQGWRQIAQLAEAINAALGCTRPAVDEGWAGIETMIGQSGKMISPQVYVGVGISGDQQHMIGISDARLMVAINSDSNAPVFEQVDYGVADDFREFIPALLAKIKTYREKITSCTS